MECGEIEIGLHRTGASLFEIELRINDPENQAETAPVRGRAGIDLDELLSLQTNPVQYGQALTRQLFEDPAVSQLYSNTRAAFDSRRLTLRLRLLIGASLPELHSVRWELLRDPVSGSPIATSERVLFSRYMVSQDWRMVKLRPKAKLTALIAVSAPSDLADYGLADIDKAGEIARAKEALAGIQATVAGQNEPLTPATFIDALRAGVDIVYLVCHGALPKGKDPVLFLQNAEGKTARVMAADLAQRISELTEAPRLMVLASCESAGTAAGTSTEAKAALAPRLADAGVPAVVAMLGQISMETVKAAMPAFFRELTQDGQIDRAMSVARGAVRDRSDSWMPALFLRLKNGRIWYEPAFAGDGDQLTIWDAICASVETGEFIPIVGPELGEANFGGFHQVARQLAQKYKFPMAAHESADLAKVMQYLTIKQARHFAEGELPKQIAVNIAGPGNRRRLNDILRDDVVAKSGETDPYQILAQLPASVFITASPEASLTLSLQAAGKEPESLACAWRTTGSNHPAPPARIKATNPTPEQPLVYHVFGSFDVKNSLVLTEDDFFDYAMAAHRYHLIPLDVKGPLVQSSLLFLGFRLDDWTFRVLFRLIMALDGASMMGEFAHVGVQVSPDEHTLADADKARAYLNDYFGSRRGVGQPSINVYWGSSADFLRELRERLPAPEQSKVRAAAAV